MDLNQRKLTKSEWESIEIPVPNDEKDVLKLIMDGYNDVNIYACIVYSSISIYNF